MLSFCELLEQRLRGIELERQSRFSYSFRCGLLVHLLALEISLQRIEEQPIMGNGVPVKHLLLLLRTDTLVFEKEIQELRLREVKIILVTHSSRKSEIG